MRSSDTTMGGKQGAFPVTRWSIILNAKDKESKDYKETAESLVSLYWKPVYKYIRLAWSKTNEDSKDLTQEFFIGLLEKNSLKSVSPDLGRFRTFIKTSLKNFLINKEKERKRQKRGGDVGHISYEEHVKDSVESVKSSDPADIFDREWAREVLTRGLKRLGAELIKRGREKSLQAFQMYYIEQPAGEKSTRVNIGAQLRISETEVKGYLEYSRKLLRKIIEDEVKDYLADGSDIDKEVNYLLSIKL
ncbi:MAG: sigma-70 family RNA polymerase sigma factor [Planctomycetes bacterium]|nr:sigma-70 family RNA polymerase sigma factor [Planctomycetota bacterium]